MLRNIGRGHKCATATLVFLWSVMSFDVMSQQQKEYPWYNDGVELTKENGVFPATLLPIKNPIGTAYPILRVGATGYYTDAPALYESSWGGSNFGESFVDLLAPGANIPALTIDENGLLLSEQSRGTSPATAITGGTVALLSKCAGQATGQLT